MFGTGIVICFCVYFYAFQLKSVQSAYKDAAGLWKEDMWRSYAANAFNLVMNIILVQLVGIYGILLSTILALTVITYPWQTWMIHKKLFHCSMWEYLKKLAVYADYEELPQTPYRFSMWQYSSTGSVPGIEGNVDLNIQLLKK